MERKTGFWHNVVSVILGIYCLITIVLLLVVFISSFRPYAETFKNIWSLPQQFILTNYIYIFQHNFLTYFWNSLFVTVVSIVALLFLASLAAFGLGKYKFKGSGLLLGFFFLGAMFPAQVGIVPLFNIVTAFHLTNSLIGLIVIYASGLSIPVFILTNFMKTIPDSILESARIDGAGTFRVYRQILVPLIMPAIGALIPLTAVGLWNDLFFPLVFINSTNLRTIPLGVLTYYSGRQGAMKMAQFGIIFAAISVSILPMLILYLAGSRYIIEGITTGAVKE